MGCHTWTYKKIESLDEDFKKDEVKSLIEEIKNYWFRRVTMKEYVKEMMGYIKENPNLSDRSFKVNEIKERYNQKIKKSNETLKNLEENGFSALIEHLEKNENSNLLKYKGKLYYKINSDFPFRVYGYPDEILTKMEDLLKWLKSRKPETIGFYSNNDDNYKFIPGYTDELEKRIREYYEKHGKSNLLFRFG